MNYTHYILDKIFKSCSAEIPKEYQKDLYQNSNKIIKKISISRIEEFFLIKSKELFFGKIFDDLSIKNLKHKSKLRKIRTLENYRFANLIALELDKLKIDYVFLKGVSAIDQFYDDFSIRHLSDIDIFINKNDLHHLIKILRENDFNTTIWDKLKGSNFQLYKNPSPKHKSLPCQVDIHTSIFGNENRDKIFKDFLKVKTVKSQKFSNKINICPPELLFIHLLYHGTVHSQYNVGPVFFMDMINILSSNKIEWAKASSLVKKFNLQKELNYVLTALQEYADIPKDLDFKEQVNKNMLKAIFLSPPNNTGLLRPLSKEGVGNQIRFIFAHMFSRKSYLHHSEEKNSIFKLVRHIFNLFKRHIQRLIRSDNAIKISRNRFRLLR